MESMRARRPPAPIANRTIVLYGERHSGTNLLYSVLKKCFHIQTEYSGLYGFKHWWLGQENSSREALVPAAWAHNGSDAISTLFAVRSPVGWVRGMFDQFIARDMDGDGDTDLVGTRGNSGRLDGVFWLEQVRSAQPRAAFAPARAQESRPLPLPPADWLDRYPEANTLVAPNKR